MNAVRAAMCSRQIGRYRNEMRLAVVYVLEDEQSTVGYGVTVNIAASHGFLT